MMVAQVLGILYWCNIVENEWHGGLRYSGQGDGFQSVSYMYICIASQQYQYDISESEWEQVLGILGRWRWFIENYSPEAGCSHIQPPLNLSCEYFFFSTNQNLCKNYHWYSAIADIFLL